MNDDRESVAWHAVNALIEDARRQFKGARGEAFALGNLQRCQAHQGPGIRKSSRTVAKTPHQYP
jgi:hypothetical protein